MKGTGGLKAGKGLENRAYGPLGLSALPKEIID